MQKTKLILLYLLKIKIKLIILQKRCCKTLNYILSSINYGESKYKVFDLFNVAYAFL